MSDQMPEPGAAPKVRPWLRVLLAASLGLNLLIVGLAIGTAWRIGKPDHDRPPPTGVSLIRALPIEDRRAVLSRMRDETPPRAKWGAEAKAMADILRASPFDSAALAGEVSRQTHARDSFQSVLLRVWLDHVAQMDDAERAGYADRLEALSRRDHDKRGQKKYHSRD